MTSVRILIALAILATRVQAQDAPRMINPAGFAVIDWMLSPSTGDLYDIWAEHGANGKLQGPVARYLDWPNVSNIVVLHNGWHLLAQGRDARIQHIEDHLSRAAFGARFKGRNPGGEYILMLQYRGSDRKVVVGFKDGVFLIEGLEGIGIVDIRGTPR
jgi:hypothetical protein